MSNYVLIESRDPFESPDTAFLTETAMSLKKEGHDVVVFLLQNAVLAMRKQARQSQLPQLLESGIPVLADEFALRERGIQADECPASITVTNFDHLVDLIIRENTRAVWH